MTANDNVVKKMEKWREHEPPLHEESLTFIEGVFKMSSISVNELTEDEFRKQIDDVFAKFFQQIEYDGKIQDMSVPSDDRKEGVPIRIYKPNNIQQDPAIMIYFHGGGMVLSGYHNTISLNKVMSSRFKCIIVDVEYRLCPETKALSAFDDCKVVTEWVMQNKSNIGGTDLSAVGVCGDSAGGLISVVVTHLVEGLDFQIPIYPWLDMANSLPSRTEFADGPICLLEWLKWFSKRVVDPDFGDAKDTRWSPLYHRKDDVKKVPPALFILAEVDPCKDDGKVYAKTLIDAGVPAGVFEIKGSLHGFITVPEHFKELTGQAYTKMAKFLDWIKEVKLSVMQKI